MDFGFALIFSWLLKYCDSTRKFDMYHLIVCYVFVSLVKNMFNFEVKIFH